LIKADAQAICEAAKVLRRGGIVAYPTDTVYGLGCDPYNVDAIKRLIDIKAGRRKPLPVLASGIDKIERIAVFTDLARKLAGKYWPGPLTIVLERKPALPDIITFGLNTVGVRIPNHPVALKLIKRCGGLLIGTSANLSGSKPPVAANEVREQIGDKVDFILDGGETPLKRESTVVSLIYGKLEVIRAGPISEDCIKAALK
jgi:L-threonylcarbamoyladenylate synthase